MNILFMKVVIYSFLVFQCVKFLPFLGLVSSVSVYDGWLITSFGSVLSLSAFILLVVLTCLNESLVVGSFPLALVSGIIPVLFMNSGHWMTMLVFYELSLVPISYLILKSGKQPERLRACRFIMLYTVLFSVPFLLSLLFLMKEFHSLEVFELSMLASLKEVPDIFLWGVAIGFLVKVPMIFFHYWLPKAHVEASASGSVLLAGVLLKMGALGLFQLSFLASPTYSSIVWIMVVGISISGGSIAALQALWSSDMKIIVAFASVSHMNFSLAIYFTLNSMSLKSFICYNFSHSLIASALFILVTVGYKWSNSRGILANKGNFSVFQLKVASYGLWAANMSLPPFVNFTAEVLGAVCLGSVSLVLMLPLAFFIMVSSIYSSIFMIVLTLDKPSGMMTLSSVKTSFMLFSLVLPVLLMTGSVLVLS